MVPIRLPLKAYHKPSDHITAGRVFFVRHTLCSVISLLLKQLPLQGAALSSSEQLAPTPPDTLLGRRPCQDKKQVSRLCLNLASAPLLTGYYNVLVKSLGTKPARDKHITSFTEHLQLHKGSLSQAQEDLKSSLKLHFKIWAKTGREREE